MEFTLAEQFFLVAFEGLLRVYDLFRDRPRMFWAAWMALSATAALYLLRPADSEPSLATRRRL